MSITAGNDLALVGMSAQGENNWHAAMEASLRFLDSAAHHFDAIDIVSATPSSPTRGDTYLTSPAHPTNPNKVIRFVSGSSWDVWTPKAGWTAALRNPSSGTAGRLVQSVGGVWYDGISTNAVAAGSINGTSGFFSTADITQLTQNTGANVRLTSGGKFQGTGLNLSNGIANAVGYFNSSLDLIASSKFTFNGTQIGVGTVSGQRVSIPRLFLQQDPGNEGGSEIELSAAGGSGGVDAASCKLILHGYRLQASTSGQFALKRYRASDTSWVEMIKTTTPGTDGAIDVTFMGAATFNGSALRSWGPTYKPLHFGLSTSAAAKNWGSGDSLYLMNNVYRDSNDAWKAVSGIGDCVSLILSGDGVLSYQRGENPGAGATATMVEMFGVDANGNGSFFGRCNASGYKRSAPQTFASMTITDSTWDMFQVTASGSVLTLGNSPDPVGRVFYIHAAQSATTLQISVPSGYSITYNNLTTNGPTSVFPNAGRLLRLACFGSNKWALSDA